MREIQFDLHGDGWTPDAIKEVADVLHNIIDVFSTSPTDHGECTLLLFKILVLPEEVPRCEPSHTE